MERFGLSLMAFVVRTYASFYALLELFLFVYKGKISFTYLNKLTGTCFSLGVYFSYRTWVYALEITLFVALLCSEFSLISVRSSRNHLVLVFYFVSTLLVTYYIWWQQYVLYVEIILGMIYLGMKTLMMCAFLLDFLVAPK